MSSRKGCQKTSESVLVMLQQLTKFVLERRGDRWVIEVGCMVAELDSDPRAGIFFEAVLVDEDFPVAHCSNVVGYVSSDLVDGGSELCVELVEVLIVVLSKVLKAWPVGSKLLLFIL